jgi:hypothetical protein
MFTRMLGDDELGDIVFVLDGLDECDQTSLTQLLRKLSTLFSKKLPPSGKRFKLLVASRETTGTNFKPDYSIDLSFIGSFHINYDIDCFIDEKPRKLADTVGYFDNVRGDVQRTLIKRADGTFLRIGLLIQELEYSDASPAEEVNDLIKGIQMNWI